MKTDPLIQATRKAYRASETCKLDRLLAERKRWEHKQTLARNKLKAVTRQIEELTREGFSQSARLPKVYVCPSIRLISSRDCPGRWPDSLSQFEK